MGSFSSGCAIQWKAPLARLARCLSLLVLVVRLGAGDAVINEIHYQPTSSTDPTEFIELYNTAEAEIDLSG